MKIINKKLEPITLIQKAISLDGRCIYLAKTPIAPKIIIDKTNANFALTSDSYFLLI
ncbi:hypothetical protein D3C79_1060360 [compost metagenome]